MPQEGMLLQMDGSHHAWLEDRGPRLTLLLAVDDATGTTPYALFHEQEDTQGYLLLMQGIVQKHGIPLAVYTDRHAVFQQTRAWTDEASRTRDHQPTQVGRALRELGVTQIFAHSPEAKGRVERANGTFQDRLVAELRLAGADSLQEANRVLEAFLPRFNDRFGVPAVQPGSAYRLPDAGLDVEGVLCIKERRRVAKDNTVQYHGRTLQLYPGLDRPSYARAHVEVQERLDGRLLVAYRGRLLTPEDAPPLASALRASASSPVVPAQTWPLEDECAQDAHPKPPPGPLAGEPIWYEDAGKKRLHRDLVRAGMERARQEGRYIGRPRLTNQVDAQFVGERRSQGESWRQIYLAHPPVQSNSGRTVKPSIGSIRRAVEARERLAVVPTGHTMTPTAKDKENHERIAISPAPTTTNGHADMQNEVTLAILT
jgi:hypothetical protein